MLIPIVVASVYILKGICDFGQYYLMAFVGQSIIRDLRYEMFRKIEEMSVGFFVKHSTGELLSRMNNDVSLVQGALTSAITGVVRDTLTVICSGCRCFFSRF